MGTAPANGHETSIEPKWLIYDRLFQVGWSIILASGLIVFSRDRFLALYPPSITPDYYARLLGVVLLLTVLGLIFGYVFAVLGEMRMLREYLGKFAPSPPAQAYVWTIAISIVLGVLAYFTDRVLLFSAFFACYNVADLWGQAIRDRQIRRLLRQARAVSPPGTTYKAWQVIEEYYLERPHAHRIATVMFFAFVGLILAILAKSTSQASISSWLQCAAYLVVVLAIIIGKTTIHIWRRRRDRALGECYSV